MYNDEFNFIPSEQDCKPIHTGDFLLDVELNSDDDHSVQHPNDCWDDVKPYFDGDELHVSNILPYLKRLKRDPKILVRLARHLNKISDKHASSTGQSVMIDVGTDDFYITYNSDRSDSNYKYPHLFTILMRSCLDPQATNIPEVIVALLDKGYDLSSSIFLSLLMGYGADIDRYVNIYGLTIPKSRSIYYDMPFNVFCKKINNDTRLFTGLESEYPSITDCINRSLPKGKYANYVRVKSKSRYVNNFVKYISSLENDATPEEIVKYIQKAIRWLDNGLLLTRPHLNAPKNLKKYNNFSVPIFLRCINHNFGFKNLVIDHFLKDIDRSKEIKKVQKEIRKILKFNYA